MKRISLKTFWIVALGVFISMAAVRAEQPLEILTGIPVMAGLSEDLDERIIFDKPEGRIIHVALKGDVSREAALGFYRDALYQLGWQLLPAEGGAGLVFSRDQENLNLSVTATEPLELMFDLKPAS